LEDASMDQNKAQGKAIGGKARAEKLTPGERTEIAKKAASVRWQNLATEHAKDLPKATHKGEVVIGDIKIPCAVLDNGKRVISETGFAESLLGTISGASKRFKKAGGPLPVFLSSKNLEPLITIELISGPLMPIEYMDGNRIVSSYDANLLPSVCEIWLKAREEKILRKDQYPKAQKAEILMRGLAHIGIIALVDEATGYQEARDKEALQAILDRYLKKEFAAWAKRFPEEFYKEIFRLKRWPWRGTNVNRPSIVGTYTNDLVYERLAPGILEELQKRNPKDIKGNRHVKHHQFLTEDIGHPALAQHLHAVIGFMRASTSWEPFYRLIQRAFPKKLENLPLLVED
jgi:P63C domain